MLLLHSHRSEILWHLLDATFFIISDLCSGKKLHAFVGIICVIVLYCFKSEFLQQRIDRMSTGNFLQKSLLKVFHEKPFLANVLIGFQV